MWATIGAAITTLGGIAFAMGEFAFAALSWYSTDTSAISEPAGTKLLSHTIDHTGHGTVVQVVGFLAFSVGTVLLLVALIRARTVPLWLPITFFALIVAEFAPLPLRLHDFVQVGLLALLVVLAWMYVRRTIPADRGLTPLTSGTSGRPG